MRFASLIGHLEKRITLTGRPRPLDLEVEEILISEGGMSPVATADILQKTVDRVRTFLQDREAGAEEADDQPTLRVVGQAQSEVCGFCYVVATDDQKFAKARSLRANAPTLEARLRSLNFSEFELFGARLLTTLGARSGQVTSHSNDQGIDFYGEFNFGQLSDSPAPFSSLAKGVSVLFAGQAKHYPKNKIVPSVVRELVGAMMLARTKTHSKDGVDLFKDLNIRPFSPVVTLLFTTGTFTAGARRLAEAAGVIVKDCAQLAAFLADQGVGVEVEDGEAKFNESKFAAWLHEEPNVKLFSRKSSDSGPAAPSA